MVWSFVYLALRRSLELILLCFRSTEAKEIEILVCATSSRCVPSSHGAACSGRIVRCWRH